MIDSSTGTFKIRVTGRPCAELDAAAQHRRDVPARLLPRLPLLHRLRDDRPAGILTRAPARRGRRPSAPTSTARSRDGSCAEIQFADGDAINGPMHTNDDILICGTPTFGRDSADSIEVTGPAAATRLHEGRRQLPRRRPGLQRARSSRRRQVADDAADQPDAADGRQTGGLVYTGKTIIRLNGRRQHDGRPTPLDNRRAAPQTSALPGQRRHLRQERHRQLRRSRRRSTPTTTRPTGCGNVYVSGTYTPVADDRRAPTT